MLKSGYHMQLAVFEHEDRFPLPVLVAWREGGRERGGGGREGGRKGRESLVHYICFFSSK